MRKILIFFPLLILDLLPTILPLYSQDQGTAQSLKDEFEKTKQLIVMIVADINGSQEFGAGIIVGRKKDELLIATAYHLLHNGAAQANKVLIKLRAKPDNFFEANIIKHSSEDTMDLALLSVKKLSNQGVDVCSMSLDRLSDTSTLKPGDEVFSLGNPNGIPWAMPVDADKVSDILESNISFQSSFITKGNSGGALLDTSAGITGLVIADQPPFGRAINIRNIIGKLNEWGYSVDLRMRDFRGQTPLHIAADKGDVSVLKTLLLAPCRNVDQRDDHFATPLHYAAYSSTDAVKFLLKAGADLNPLDADGDPPLEWANESRNVQNMRLLINAGAAWSGWSPMVYAAIGSDLSAIKNLAKDKNNLNKSDDHRATPLHFAAAYASTEIVTLLIENGADANAEDEDGHLPLHWAAESGKIDNLKLLPNLYDVESQKYSKAYLAVIAAWKGQIEVIKFLVASGTDLDFLNRFNYHHYLLTAAVENRQYKMMEFLIKSGLDPGAVFFDEGNATLKTPLCAAVETGQIEAIEILRQAGAELNIPYSDSGYYIYPFDFVFELNWKSDFKLQLLKALVAAPQGKSSLTIKKPLREPGWSIGRIFLNKSDEDFLLEALKILIPAGADPNQRHDYYEFDKWKWKTPLTLALENGYNKAARFLRENGATK